MVLFVSIYSFKHLIKKKHILKAISKTNTNKSMIKVVPLTFCDSADGMFDAVIIS